MDPATLALTISTARTLVKSAKGLHEITHSIDAMFHAQEEHEKKKKEKPLTRQKQVLNIRTGEDTSDETSLAAVADDILEAEKQKAAIAALSAEIDAKFGEGVWQSILDERDRRVKEKEEADAKKKKELEAKREHDRALWHKILVEGGKVIILVAVTAAIAWFLWWASTAPKIR